jgi:Zn-dependent M28 family amino/carboxypeptidase
MLRLGRVLGLTTVAMLMDIARSPAVPGANDNLSGVAVLVAIADQLKRRPVEGVRVILASCGSEESLQGGIRPFMERHAPGLPVESTSFLNFDTVGSPRLVLLEGEGPLVMEDYPGGLRDTVADCATAAGIKLRRGQRARSSTDSVIPGRYGYPTATLTSFDQNKCLSNYHWPTDVPENLDYDIVADAAALGELVIRRLAAGETP